MGKKEVKDKKLVKKPKTKAKNVKKPKSKTRKRSCRELRAKYFALCKAGKFQDAWKITKLYNKRLTEKHL